MERNTFTGYSCRASPSAVWPEASGITSLSFFSPSPEQLKGHSFVVLHRLERGGCVWASLAGC